jgi:outer membrane biosynthesis protein TonB
MSNAGLDRETAERMLRGEPTGPPRLAELLTAASSELATEDLNGERAALAAFHQARSLRSGRPSMRRLPAPMSLKAALIGLLLLLAGGVTVATTAQHLTSPPENKPVHSTRTPATPRTLITRTPPRASSRPTTDRHEEKREKQPRKTAHPKKSSHPEKKPQDNAQKSNPHKHDGATRSVRMPGTSPARKSDPGGTSGRLATGT